LLHLVSVVLVLPGFVLALAFVILGRAISARSLWGFVDQLLADAVWLVPWGILAIGAAWLVVAIGGMFAGTRWLAGLCVAVVGVGSTALMLLLTSGHSNADIGQLAFYVPGLVAACIGAWLALTDRARHRVAAPRTAAGD
jgi:hypothetical protein